MTDGTKEEILLLPDFSAGQVAQLSYEDDNLRIQSSQSICAPSSRTENAPLHVDNAVLAELGRYMVQAHMEPDRILANSITHIDHSPEQALASLVLAGVAHGAETYQKAETIMQRSTNCPYLGPEYSGTDEEAVHDKTIKDRKAKIRAIVHLHDGHPKVKREVEQFEGSAAHAIPVDDQKAPLPTDALTIFLREISRYRLLDKEDEIRLFKNIERGINLYVKLGDTPETEQALVDLIIARYVLMVSNIRLAVTIAKRHANHRDLPLVDLIIAALSRLDNAVALFDYTKGYTFSTYSAQWLQQGVTSSNTEDTADMIHVPREIYRAKPKARRAVAELEFSNQTDTKWSIDEIAEKAGISAELVQAVCDTPMNTVVSLNAVDRNKRSEFGDTIASPIDRYEIIIRNISDQEFMRELLRQTGLNTHQAFILSARLKIPIDDLRGTSVRTTLGELSYDTLLPEIESSTRGMTQTALGKRLGITRQAVCSQETAILAVIRDKLNSIRKVYYADTMDNTARLPL